MDTGTTNYPNPALSTVDRVLVVLRNSDGVGTKGSVNPAEVFNGVGLGYTQDGAAVEQGTSRTTGVTIDALSGAITLVSAAGSTTAASFTVTNSTVAATDVPVVVQKSGTDKYNIGVSAVADGSFVITFRTFAGTTTEQPVFNFAIIKAVAS